MLYSVWRPVKLKLEPYRLPRRSLRPHTPAKSSLVYAVLVTLGVQAALGCALVFYRCYEADMRGMSGPFSVQMVDVEPAPEETAVRKTSVSRIVTSLPDILQAETVGKVLECPPHSPDLSWSMEAMMVSSDVFDERDMGTLMREPSMKKLGNNRTFVHSRKGGGIPVAAASGETTEAPQALEAPLPPYPASARSAGQTGVVKLLISVDEHGSVSSVSLSESSGYPSLDASALRWVKDNWLFRPARRKNLCVASQIIVPIRFKLD